MNLLSAWSLALNATHLLRDPTHGDPDAWASSCDQRSGLFDSDTCLKIQTGYNQSELEARIFNETDTVREGPPCDKSFYVFGLEEFEAAYPEAAGCWMSTYGAMALATALGAPCRTRARKDAAFLMIPPYSVFECNWPVYSGSCNHPTNQLYPKQNGWERPKCDNLGLRDTLHRVRVDNPGKPVLALEMESAVVGALKHEWRCADPGVIFATIDATRPCGSYHRGRDISMPPPATMRCSRTPPEAFTEPLAAKKYFLTFKGSVYRQLFRRQLKRALHNGQDVIIADVSEGYDFDTLLHSSRFTLVLDGDRAYSYRFVEAVCGGGVPVLMSSQWVPPFDEFVPFDTYGVQAPLARARSILGVLRNLTDEEVQRKRVNAAKACERYFKSAPLQVRALIEQLLARAAPVGDENTTVAKPSSCKARRRQLRRHMRRFEAPKHAQSRRGRRDRLHGEMMPH